MVGSWWAGWSRVKLNVLGTRIGRGRAVSIGFERGVACHRGVSVRKSGRMARGMHRVITFVTPLADESASD